MINESIMPIRPLLHIEDYSLYMFIFILILTIISIVFLYKFILNFYKKRQPVKFKKNLKKLKNIDFTDSKKAAYNITYYARLLASTNEEKHKLNQLNNKLFDYKYKQNSQNINDKTKQLYNTFIDIIQKSSK
ncbi:MAG: hypothetical protein HOH31_03080 [Campylobacteraceae bacterium]|jgi:hypothetical protein|nr:hypothetical protein [Campylobacteraceae bacterium]MBT6107557.1 hypothetical protein [Campylobacteraceae bacterium]MBT7117605.1 hypothetical protein [Campylobacteraceae bacterium]